MVLPLLTKAGSAIGSFASSPAGMSTIAGGLSSLFGGGNDIELEDLRTPEQIAAAKSLQSLAQTGTGAGITLGQGYDGALGSYDTSGQQQAYNQLQSLYNGQDITQARDVYSKATENKFNPDDPSSGYAAFSRALAKSGQEASSALDREAAITGSRFGTAIGGNKADLAADMQNQRGQFLAQLFNQGENRAMQGAQGLQDIASQQAQLAQYASAQDQYVQQVKDQEAKDALSEFQRTRNEELSRIDLLSAESNRNPYMGVSSIPGSASPFSSLANSVLGGIGSSIGDSIGDGTFSFKNLFKGGA